MRSIGKGRSFQSLGLRELAGDFRAVWTLALWLYGYLSAQNRSLQSENGLGHFLRNEISYHSDHWFDRRVPALADRAGLWLADLTFPG